MESLSLQSNLQLFLNHRPRQDQRPLPSQAPLHPFPQHQLPQPTLDLLCQQQRPLEEIHRIRMGSIEDFYTEQLSNKH